MRPQRLRGQRCRCRVCRRSVCLLPVIIPDAFTAVSGVFALCLSAGVRVASWAADTAMGRQSGRGPWSWIDAQNRERRSTGGRARLPVLRSARLATATRVRLPRLATLKPNADVGFAADGRHRPSQRRGIPRAGLSDRPCRRGSTSTSSSYRPIGSAAALYAERCCKHNNTGPGV